MWETNIWESNVKAFNVIGERKCFPLSLARLTGLTKYLLCALLYRRYLEGYRKEYGTAQLTLLSTLFWASIIFKKQLENHKRSNIFKY